MNPEQPTSTPRIRPWVPTRAPAAEATPPATEEARPVAVPRRVDLANLALIVAGAVLLILLLPPQHDYAIIDDWIYSDSVQNQLATGRFVLPDQSQANLAGLTLWGTLWARVLGFSMTTLTYSTLALALAGLLAFYGLARRLRVPPAGALFGTALLALNPMFLHLSYSFMTDVPFVALTLIACYGYVRGLQAGDGGPGLGAQHQPDERTKPRPPSHIPHVAWLWAAGLVAGWAFLMRQYGVLVPAAVGLYLLLDSLRARRMRWADLVHTALVPGLILLGWWLWTHNWPPTSATLTANGWRDAFVMKPIWPTVFALRVLDLLPVTAFSAWAALRFRPARLWLVALCVLLVGAAMVWSTTITAPLLGQTEPPFVLQVGPLAITFPQLPYSFGGDGNIIRVGGIDFYEYRQQPLWTPAVWRGLWLLGTALGALLLARIADGLLAGLRRWRAAGPLDPVLVPYLLGFLTFVVTLALSGAIYDRYVLAFLPFLILFVVRGVTSWGRLAWAYSLGALCVVALFAVLLKADAMDHTAARFRAGAWFAARGVTPGVGLDYNRGAWMFDTPWQVSDVLIPGFRVEAQFPYLSRLAGFQTRLVLAETRADQPPLAAPTR